MKKTKALIALLLTFAIILGTCATALAKEYSPNEADEIFFDGLPTSAFARNSGSSEKVWSKDPIKNYYYKNGLPALTTENFMRVYKFLRTIKNFFQGRFLWGDDDIFDVTLDEKIMESTRYMAENSCLDVSMILVNLPDFTEPAKLVNAVFQIDIEEMREQLYAVKEKYNESNPALAKLIAFTCAYMSIIEKAYLYLEPYEGDDDPNTYELMLDVTYGDGKVETFRPGILWNLETGECYGHNEDGMLGIGFNSNLKEMLVYAPMYCWMRNFGFCIEYDILCYLLPIYNYTTRRVKFEYQGKEWMIQMWKGTYLITNGGEIGVYNRDIGSVGTFYNVVTDEERLNMSLRILHGDEVLVDIPEMLHWWVNGFKVGTRMYSPHSLTMLGTIEFPNEEMLNAAIGGIEANIYHDIEYKVDGLKLSICWDT